MDQRRNVGQFPQRSKYCAGLRQRHATGAGESHRTNLPQRHQQLLRRHCSPSGCSCINWNNCSPNANLPTETSYTAKLYASGTKRIAQKVGEEGVETALAATVHDRFELTNGASDLMYHLLGVVAGSGSGFNNGDWRTCVNVISELRGKRMRCCRRIRQKTARCHHPAHFLKLKDYFAL